MPGPAPKPAATRQRRNRVASAAVLTDEGEIVIPELPEGYDKRTVRWWATVKKSPMHEEYTASDWEGLLAVAALYNLWWMTGDTKAHAEFRTAAKDYGLNPMARRSLQWEIKRAEGIAPVSTAPRRSSRSTLGVLTGGKAAQA
jgi:hypothetical protein